MASAVLEEPSFFTLTSALSLLAVLVLLGIAYGTTSAYLPTNATNKIRFLAIWHLFDVSQPLATSWKAS